jgi:hypothetical protein
MFPAWPISTRARLTRRDPGFGALDHGDEDLSNPHALNGLRHVD